jgi:hypothetical protein
MSERAVTACVTRASLAPARVSGSLSCYLGGPGLDPFRGTPHKERIGVEREHHVQGTTRVPFPCHLERPQDALGPHGQRRGAGRAAIHLDTNSYHSDPPSARDAPYALLHLLCYISVTGAQNIGNRGTSQDRVWIRPIAVANDLRSMLLYCGVMRERAWSRSSGGRCETGEADEASGD